MATGGFHPLRCRTGVQTIGVIEHKFHLRIRYPLISWRTGRTVGRIGQRGDDAFRFGTGREFLNRPFLLHQTGQATQDGDVFVGLRGNGHHQPCLLAFLPRHALRGLDHGNPGVQDMVPVFDHPVRNRHPGTEESIGNRLPLHQALDVRRGDIARVEQHLPGQTDGFFLGLYRRLNGDTVFCNRFHQPSKRKSNNRTSAFVIDYKHSVKHFYKNNFIGYKSGDYWRFSGII